MNILQQLGVPDSQLVRETQELVRELSEPFLFTHVMRSWLFAAALADVDQASMDREMLAIALLLHDLGLTHKHRHEPERFEVSGANAARTFLNSRRVVLSDIESVWDAIALHTTRSIALHKNALVAYCHHGVQADISGMKLDAIPLEIQQHILLEFPRLSLKEKLTDLLCSVVVEKPTTSYDNFLKDFGERYVAQYHAPSAVDRLNAAPFED